MPDAALIWILNRGVELGAIILLLLPLRLVLRKSAPRIFCYMLWLVLPISVVYFRLTNLFPEIPYSMINAVHNLPKIFLDRKWIDVCKAVYGAGVMLQVVHLLYSYIRVHRCVIGSTRYRDNVYVTDRIVSPFTFGLIHPTIYLPSKFAEAHYEAIILHEKTHIVRKDIWMKHLGILLRVIFWFQPLVWIGFHLFEADVELACDEAVIKDRDESFRKQYATALYYETVEEEKIESIAAGYGGGEVGVRIRFIMSYQKPKRYARVLAVVLCIVFVGVAIPMSWQVPQLFWSVTENEMLDADEELGITGMELPIQ